MPLSIRFALKLIAALTLSMSAAGFSNAEVPVLVAFSAGASAQPPVPWRAVGLPGNKAPLAQLDLTSMDGTRVLRLQTDRSYGTLVHPVPSWTPGPASSLQWRWRLEQPLVGADLRRKEGDDAALKVCVMFDMPLDGLRMIERNLLRLARSVSGERLPAATICYVWDSTLARDTALPNAFSGRVRYIIADGADSAPGQWRSHERRIHADFLRLFGDETVGVPPVVAIAVGADADNTAGRSLAYLGDVRLLP